MRVCLITARLKSTRLPRKALRDLGGKPLIAHLIARMRALPVDRVVLCTSPLAEDDALEDLARAEHIGIFRGDAEDVLVRLRDAARRYRAHAVVNVTGDNPFVDARHLTRLLEFHERGDFDLSRSRGLPFGAFGFALKAQALERVCALKAERDTEVWGPYFETGAFSCGWQEVDRAATWPELRLTVDTPEDLALAERIVAGVGDHASVETIVAWCRAHPEAVALNAAVHQKPARPVRMR